MNLTQKYLPFLCLCYQSPCALLLTGGICDHDVIVVCIVPRIAYIFFWSWKPYVSFSKVAAVVNCRDFAVIFAIFTKVCRVFLPFFAVIFYCLYLQQSVAIPYVVQQRCLNKQNVRSAISAIAGLVVSECC